MEVADSGGLSDWWTRPTEHPNKVNFLILLFFVATVPPLARMLGRYLTSPTKRPEASSSLKGRVRPLETRKLPALKNTQKAQGDPTTLLQIAAGHMGLTHGIVGETQRKTAMGYIKGHTGPGRPVIMATPGGLDLEDLPADVIEVESTRDIERVNKERKGDVVAIWLSYPQVTEENLLNFTDNQSLGIPVHVDCELSAAGLPAKKFNKSVSSITTRVDGIPLLVCKEEVLISMLNRDLTTVLGKGHEQLYRAIFGAAPAPLDCTATTTNLWQAGTNGLNEKEGNASALAKRIADDKELKCERRGDSSLVVFNTDNPIVTAQKLHNKGYHVSIAGDSVLIGVQPTDNELATDLKTIQGETDKLQVKASTKVDIGMLNKMARLAHGVALRVCKHLGGN